VNAALEMRDLRFRYPDETEALRGFSAVVAEGECVGIVGPNGAGKTTLALLLAGFLEPGAGQVRLFGRAITPQEIGQARIEIGFTFHDPDDQLFMPTVLEDVCFGPLCAGVPPDDAVHQARAMLTALEIEDLAGRFPGHLSAGQKRLATLAGVLVMNPRVLVLDEPTAFLDPHARRQVLSHLQRLPQSKVLITHDLDLVVELCSGVVVMSAGRDVASGPPRQILADAGLIHTHRLEVPPLLRTVHA
jgi:cobalt/nickel transport system ATP-binding protein